MNSGDIAQPIKSCIWLGYQILNLPLEVITTPSVPGSKRDSLKFGFLEDEFEIFVMKSFSSVLHVAVCRKRQNPNERPDDGYALRFYFTLIGFDEEPQTAIMKHDGESSDPPAAFNVTESILGKVNTTHHLFELFVVIHMLEFKSVSIRNETKQKIDEFMYFLRKHLPRPEKRNLGFILKSPNLKNTFTGRLPLFDMESIFFILASMYQDLAGIAEYLRARENRDSENSNLDLSRILIFFGLATDEGPVPPEEAVEKYLLAHKLGLDCYKTIASDYLVSILDNDYDVLDVLEASLLVHDKDLFEKAIISFLNRFHEITRSGKFQYFIRFKGIIARLIIHSSRVWVSNNDVYIPTWEPTTEL